MKAIKSGIHMISFSLILQPILIVHYKEKSLNAKKCKDHVCSKVFNIYIYIIFDKMLKRYDKWGKCQTKNVNATIKKTQFTTTTTIITDIQNKLFKIKMRKKILPIDKKKIDRTFLDLNL